MQLYYSSDSDTATIASDNQTNRDFISPSCPYQGDDLSHQVNKYGDTYPQPKNDVSMQIYTQL